MRTYIKESDCVQICYNAEEAGLIGDPRVGYNGRPATCSVYALRMELGTPKEPGSPAFPAVCGNCRWYSVQM